MSTTNNAVLFIAAQQNGAATVEVSSSIAAAQAGATRLTNNLSRCKQAVASGSFVLPQIGSGEASREMLLVNDSPNTVNVYPWVGEKLNGTVNAALSIASGATGIAYPVLNSTYNYPSTLDWRATVIS
jgi:hypothetical protein